MDLEVPPGPFSRRTKPLVALRADVRRAPWDATGISQMSFKRRRSLTIALGG